MTNLKASLLRIFGFPKFPLKLFTHEQRFHEREYLSTWVDFNQIKINHSECAKIPHLRDIEME